MGRIKGPSEGGSGGKRGHSNMTHWEHTEEVKESSNIQRRNDDKKEVTEGIKNFEQDRGKGSQ